MEDQNLKANTAQPPTPFDALLLSAGYGTRLRPITNLIPKCLCPVQGEPILGFWIKKLINAGVDNIWINGHTHAGLVAKYLKDKHWWNKIHWCPESTLLGTGGTLQSVLTHRRDLKRPLFVIHVDNFSTISIREMLRAHTQHTHEQCIATLALFHADQPSQCGIVTRNDQGLLTSFTEKPHHPISNLANAAVYIFESERLMNSNLMIDGIKDISLDLIPKLVHRSHTYLHSGQHIDIGNIIAYSKALLVKQPSQKQPKSTQVTEKFNTIHNSSLVLKA